VAGIDRCVNFPVFFRCIMTLENLHPRAHPKIALILVVIIVAVAGGLLLAAGEPPNVIDITLTPNPAQVTDLVDLTATVEGAPGSQSIVTVDPLHKVVGQLSAVLGPDGFPMIAYRVSSAFGEPDSGTYFTKCGDVGCTTGNVTTKLFSFGTANIGITVGGDGFPVIALNDGTSALVVIKCGNATCSSGNTTTIIEPGGVGVGASNLSGGIGGDGLPVFSYKRGANNLLDNRINLLHCDNASCSAFTITTVDQNDGTINDSFGAESNLAIGADGLPIMVYRPGQTPNNAVKVAKCGNATCSSGNTLTLVSGFRTNAGYRIQIAVGPDGLPVVQFVNIFAANAVRVIKCGNAACSVGNVTSTAVTLDRAPNRTGSMAIGPDNLPVITWAEFIPGTQNDRFWKLLKCGNTNCSSGNTVTVLEAGHSGLGGTVLMRSDNRPIATQGGGFDLPTEFNPSPRVRVADCFNAACTPEGSTVAAAEFFIGSTDPGQGNGIPMSAADGAFDGPSEVATAVIDTLTLGEGSFEVNVRVQDSRGTWSEVLTRTLVVNPLTQRPVDPGSGTSPVTLTFSGVTQDGSSSLEISSTGPTPPSGFFVGNPKTYFDVTSTVVYSSVEVCINYTGISYQKENRIKLFHFVNDDWVDATTSLDKVDNIVCGTVSSLSLFAAFESDEPSVPIVGEITAPQDPIQVGTTVEASAGLTYDGNFSDLEAVWAWGDGETSPGTIVETPVASVSGSHVYDVAGVNRVILTVTSIPEGTSGSGTFEFVVVFDPEGGYVTGAGFINSPAGAFTAAPSMYGKATFGFVSRYRRGATVPTGRTVFVFRVADLRFQSTSYDFLVISGARAQYKGTGTINGEGNFKFLLTATDSAVSGGGDVDKFRIKIFVAGGGVIYDNQPGAKDDANLTTELGGGNIRIHKAK